MSGRRGRPFKISLQSASGRSFWMSKTVALSSLEKLCSLWEYDNRMDIRYHTAKPPRYEELRQEALSACRKLYISTHELNDMEFDVDLMLNSINTAQWSYMNNYLVGTTAKNCCIELYNIENIYHSQSLYTWEEFQVVRDIADVDNGTFSPEHLLSHDLFGLTETLYDLMHFLSIDYF